MPMIPEPAECRIRSTGDVVTVKEFRAMHPNVSFPVVLNPEALEGFGADLVHISDAPTVTEAQIAYRDGVTQGGLGNWVYKWAVRDLTAEEIEARKPPIPRVVTMRQARLALLGAGLLDQIATKIAELPSPQKEAAQIEWEYSQEVHRDKELVGVLAPMLGLTGADLDQMFITAAIL